jgi:hypothetical protein
VNGVGVTDSRFKQVFVLAVLAVWGLVVGAALFKYLMQNGPMPDAILLGVPTGTWLAVYPPLPSRLREEAAPSAVSE